MKDLTKKTIIAILATVIMLVLLGLGIGQLNNKLFLSDQHERSERKIDFAADMLTQMGADLQKYNEWYDENASHNVNFMAAMLQRFVAGDAYTGPRVFDDGVVVEIRDGEVVYPAAMPEHFVEISEEQIREGLADKYNYVGMGRVYDPETWDQEDTPYDIEHVTDEADYMSKHYLMYVSAISDNVFYVDRTPGTEFYEYMGVLGDSDAAMQTAEKTYGGGFLYIDLREDSLPIRNESTYFKGCKSAAELGITKEMLQERPEVAHFNGQDYVCVYRDSSAVGILMWLYAYPIDDVDSGRNTRILFIVLIMLMNAAVLIVYVSSVQFFVRDNQLTESQEKRYPPERLRSRAIAGAILGAAVVFLMTTVIQAVGALHAETISGKDSLSALFGQLMENEQYKDELTAREEEEWYTYFGERMAKMISEYPDLGSRSGLQKLCDALDVDYIMLFDSNGRMTSCNRDYTGFAIEKKEGGYLNGFARLLNGVPYIVQTPGYDQLTGLTRQLIGVTMPKEEDTGMHGALIMAVDPGMTQHGGANETDNRLAILTDDGTICFSANEETGEIGYSSNAALVGGNVTDYGLEKDSLKNGYMDFAMVNGRYSYILTEKRDSSVYYYVAEAARVFRHLFLYAFTAAAGFLVTAMILIMILMRGYTQKEFERLSEVGDPPQDGDVIDVLSEDGRTRLTIDPSRRWMRKISDWLNMLPEQQAGIVARMALCLIFVFYLLMMYFTNLSGDDAYELFNYILHGDWMRGPNLFSFCAIGIVCLGAFLFLIISRRVLETLSRFLDSKGETICRLLLNFIQYIMVFVVLYNVFSYLGFPTGTVLASLGLVTLALSLGAQNMVSDILAGVAIVFEGEFQVGDIVVIDDFQGTIQEIGVRTTKIIDTGGNIKIVNNNNIKNVVNKTRMNSWYWIELVVPASEPLLRIEEILKRELPKIGAKYDQIISGPNYSGVNGINDRNIIPRQNTVTLLIVAECKEIDYRAVRRIVNRELKLLCERENIPLL